MICVNDEHPLKAEFPIEVTEEGIVIISIFDEKHCKYDLNLEELLQNLIIDLTLGKK